MQYERVAESSFLVVILDVNDKAQEHSYSFASSLSFISQASYGIAARIIETNCVDHHHNFSRKMVPFRGSHEDQLIE